MANINRPKGLSPVSLLSGLPLAGAARLYYIPTDSTFTYAIGDVVISAASADADGIPAVKKLANAAQASGVPLGIIVGFRVADPGVSLVGSSLSLEKTYLNKSAGARYAYVVDDPNVLFEVQFDSTAVAVTDLHKNASLSITDDQTSALSPSSPQSSTTVTAPNTTNTLPIRLLGAIQDPTNTVGAYVRVLAKFNNHEFGVGTGTNFTGI